MSRYLSITKIVILESIHFRIHFISTFLGNMLYLSIIYYVWKAVFTYNNNTVISGMTFGETFFYVVLAHAILSVMGTLIDGEIARHILNGEITNILTKPLNYMYRMYFHNLGLAVTNFILIFAPTLFIIFGVSQKQFSLFRLFCFLLGLYLGHVISFLLDYITGITVFYTGNIWGIRGVKDTLVTLLSGLLLPLPYYPQVVQHVINMLPFRAVYDLPIHLFVNYHLSGNEVLSIYGVQIFWILVLFCIGSLEYRCLYKKLSINGG